jgi:hypothetical protein
VFEVEGGGGGGRRRRRRRRERERERERESAVNTSEWSLSPYLSGLNPIRRAFRPLSPSFSSVVLIQAARQKENTPRSLRKHTVHPGGRISPSALNPTIEKIKFEACTAVEYAGAYVQRRARWRSIHQRPGCD